MKITKIKRTTIIVVAIAIVVALIASITIFVILKSNSPANRATALLKNELGSFQNDMKIDKIFYNNSKKKCVIEFHVASAADIAVVDQDKETIGLQSMFDELSNSARTATSNSEKQRIAKATLNYPYDSALVFSLTQSLDGWEVITN